MIYKPTRREFLKYAGVGALAFGVPMLLKVREAHALATRGVGPTYISVGATQTNNGSLVGTTIGRSLVAVIFFYDPTNSIFPVINVSGESNMTLIPGSLFGRSRRSRLCRICHHGIRRLTDFEPARQFGI
jgi:hypothetical protein